MFGLVLRGERVVLLGDGARGGRPLDDGVSLASVPAEETLLGDPSPQSRGESTASEPLEKNAASTAVAHPVPGLTAVRSGEVPRGDPCRRSGELKHDAIQLLCRLALKVPMR